MINCCVRIDEDGTKTLVSTEDVVSAIEMAYANADAAHEIIESLLAGEQVTTMQATFCLVTDTEAWKWTS